MAVVWLNVRSDLRRRWRSLCLLALLVGLVGGVVLTGLAGARRTDSALARLLQQTSNDDASVEVSPEYFDVIAALPEVKAVAPASFMFVQPLGFESDDLVPLAGTDERFGNLVDRPRLIEGRRPSPGNADEVLLNSEAARRLGVGAGDRLTLSSLTPQQVEQLIAGEDPGEPAGPTVAVVVVGVGVTAEDLANRSLIVLLTPAFYVAHKDAVGHFDDILQVQLERGEADIAAFSAGVQRVVPDSEGAIIETAAETVGEIEDATSVQATALIALAAAAALAGLVAIGQALSRQIAVSSAEQPVLRALGLNGRQRFTALLLPMVLVAIGGASLAVAATLLASPITPNGFARRVEPDPGFAADWFVLGIGFVAVVLIVSAGAALSARSGARRLANRSAAPSAGGVVARIARIGAPSSVLVGVRMALQSGRGQTAIPVRPALAGAVAGVAGLVAALTFGAGLDWVVTDRAAYGWAWDTSVNGPSTGVELNQLASRLSEDQTVDGVASLRVQPILLGGQPLTSYGLDARKGSGFVTVLQGRAPNGADEVLVGTATLDRLDRAVGESLPVTGMLGNVPRTLTIVGRGVFPEFIHPAVPDSDTAAYNDFALLTEAGAQPFAADAGGEYFGVVLVRWAPGIDTATAASGIDDDSVTVASTTLPSNLENFTHVESFPLIVAAFLVVLAVVALTHALVTSVQRRARDLAVLKALGFVGSQIRATLAAQASTVASIGLVLGIPSGLVIGRLVWAVVARNLGVDDYIPIPLVAIVLTIPGAFILANLAAAVPARTAVRARVDVLLRRE
jgi:ABC-type lipoprotein release transport system permease subunit